MLPYIIVFILSSSMFYFSSKFDGTWKYVFLAFAVLIPSVLAGCRDITIGRDFENYILPVWNEVTTCEEIEDLLIVTVLNDVEIAYVFFNYLISLFTDDIHWFLFAYQLVIMLILARVFLKTRESGNAHHFIMFYFLYYYCECLSMMRQSLAIVLVLWAVSCLFERNYLAYYAVGALALLCHNSAVFVFIFHPLLLFIQRYGEDRILVTMLVCVVALAFFVVFKSLVSILSDSGLIMSKYSNYANQEDMRVHKMDLLFLGTVFLYLFLKVEDYCEYTYFLYYILLIALVLTMFGNITEIATRMAYYFVLPVLMLIPFLRDQSIEHNRLFVLTYVMICVYFVYMAVFTDLADTIPYRSAILGL